MWLDCLIGHIGDYCVDEKKIVISFNRQFTLEFVLGCSKAFDLDCWNSITSDSLLVFPIYGFVWLLQVLLCNAFVWFGCFRDLGKQ